MPNGMLMSTSCSITNEHLVQNCTVGVWCQHSKDRTFYTFDNFRIPPLIAIVFNSPTMRLVCLNNVVLPLRQFLQITNIKNVDKNVDKQDKVAIQNHQLRSLPSVDGGDVFCESTDENKKKVKFTIPNTCVQVIIQAILTLAEKKKA
jgi:hypothetical protein